MCSLRDRCSSPEFEIRITIQPRQCLTMSPPKKRKVTWQNVVLAICTTVKFCTRFNLAFSLDVQKLWNLVYENSSWNPVCQTDCVWNSVWIFFGFFWILSLQVAFHFSLAIRSRRENFRRAARHKASARVPSQSVSIWSNASRDAGKRSSSRSFSRWERLISFEYTRLERLTDIRRNV